MDNFNDTTKKIVLLLIAHFFVLLVLGYFIRNSKPINSAFSETTFLVYGTGLLFGIVFSIIKLFLLRFSIKNSVTKSKNKATMSFYGQYLFRYFLTGLVLYIGAVNDNIDFFGTILGILSLQSSSYVVGLMIKKDPNMKNQVEELEKKLEL